MCNATKYCAMLCCIMLYRFAPPQKNSIQCIDPWTIGSWIKILDPLIKIWIKILIHWSRYLDPFLVKMDNHWIGSNQWIKISWSIDQDFLKKPWSIGNGSIQLQWIKILIHFGSRKSQNGSRLKNCESQWIEVRQWIEIVSKTNRKLGILRKPGNPISILNA